MAYRTAYLDALVLLSRAFDLAEARGVARPVIVGGSAVEYYTAGAVISGDFDLVTSATDVVADALVQVGFRREGRRGFRLGGFVHPELLVAVDFVSGNLFDGRTDRSRLRISVVDQAKVIFPPIEDMIADRLGQYASDPSGREDMLEQARLLISLASDLDEVYLERRALEESAEPALLQRLLAERSRG